MTANRQRHTLSLSRTHTYTKRHTHLNTCTHAYTLPVPVSPMMMTLNIISHVSPMLPFLGSRGFLFSSFGCSCERIGSPPLFKGALPYWNAAPNRDSMVCALQLSTTHTHAFQFLPSTMPCIARLKKPCYCVCKSCMLWCLGLHVWHHNIPIGIPSTGLKSVMVSWCRCTHELLHACLHMCTRHVKKTKYTLVGKNAIYKTMFCKQN